jgi:hypothetical protein
MGVDKGVSLDGRSKAIHAAARLMALHVCAANADFLRRPALGQGLVKRSLTVTPGEGKRRATTQRTSLCLLLPDFSYSGPHAGLTGTINLERVVASPAGCTF